LYPPATELLRQILDGLKGVSWRVPYQRRSEVRAASPTRRVRVTCCDPDRDVVPDSDASPTPARVRLQWGARWRSQASPAGPRTSRSSSSSLDSVRPAQVRIEDVQKMIGALDVAGVVAWQLFDRGIREALT
jgi:hypothetical protein